VDALLRLQPGGHHPCELLEHLVEVAALPIEASLEVRAAQVIVGLGRASIEA
jgi:hypothetical protein